MLVRSWDHLKVKIKSLVLSRRAKIKFSCLGEKEKGFFGFDLTVAQQNLWGNYSHPEEEEEQSFFSVFGVFFPAVTGIVAGANMSGYILKSTHLKPIFSSDLSSRSANVCQPV